MGERDRRHTGESPPYIHAHPYLYWGRVRWVHARSQTICQLFEEDRITTRRVTETYFFSVLRLLRRLYECHQTFLDTSRLLGCGPRRYLPDTQPVRAAERVHGVIVRTIMGANEHRSQAPRSKIFWICTYQTVPRPYLPYLPQTREKYCCVIPRCHTSLSRPEGSLPVSQHNVYRASSFQCREGNSNDQPEVEP